jgi:ATP-dependent Lon protease
MPLRNSLLLPLTAAPLTVDKVASIRVAEAMRREQLIGIVLPRYAKTEILRPGDLYAVATVAEILREATLNYGQRLRTLLQVAALEQFDPPISQYWDHFCIFL